ncbi:MAG: hypothetical protein UW58_C0011G0001, partial [Candidatus Collierbacteria bacterium GW2011_GWC2_44_30]
MALIVDESAFDHEAAEGGARWYAGDDFEGFVRVFLSQHPQLIGLDFKSFCYAI